MKKQKKKSPQKRATAQRADSQTAAMKTANLAIESKAPPPPPVNNPIDANIQESDSKVAPLSSAEALSTEQHARLAELEKIIEEGLPYALRVCCAMGEIKARGLYYPHQTFHLYCQARWHLGKSTCYAYANAGHAFQLIESSGEDCLPQNEAQLRPLLDLDDEQVVEVWSAAVKLAGKGGLSEKMVREARRMVIEPPSKRPDLKEQTHAMRQAIYRAWEKWPAEERPYLMEELVTLILCLCEELEADELPKPIQMLVKANKQESQSPEAESSDPTQGKQSDE
jgi:hypothetical protein